MVLRIRIENKKGKHYICLDRKDYTMYLDEKEVLLQEGLVAKVESYEVENHGQLTIFNLYITDDMVKKEQKRRTHDFILPIILLSIHYLLYTYIYILKFLEYNQAE